MNHIYIYSFTFQIYNKKLIYIITYNRTNQLKIYLL